MKFRCIVEYEYPVDHKPPVEAGIVLHGDKVVTRSITPLPKGHRRLIAEPTEEDIAETIGGNNDFADCIRESVKAVFDNAPTIIEAESEDKG